MRITSPKLDTSHLSRTDEVFSRCEKAMQLKDAGNYLGAQEVMRPLWKGVGHRPDTRDFTLQLLQNYCFV